MNLNWVDAVLLIILIAATTAGIFEGFAKQVFGLLAVVVALILAIRFYRQVSWFYLRFFSQENLAQLIGFLTVFFVVVCLGAVFSYLASKLIRGPLKPLNKILGGCLGLLKGIFICGVVVFALLVFPMNKKAVKKSRVSPFCLFMTRAVVSLVPKDLKEKFREAYRELRERVEEDGKRI